MHEGITSLVLREAYSQIKDNDVVLYPLGDNGVIIKYFLNHVMNIQEHAIIDQQLSKYMPDIFSIKELKQIPNYESCVFLITSNKACFSRYLLEQGITQINIINPWMKCNELIMNCFIYIIANKEYKNILDFHAFLYDCGQFTKSFYSSSEDKMYLFDDKQFFTTYSINELPGFKNLYSPCKEFDVCIMVIRKEMNKKDIESIIAKQLVQKIPLFCISENSLDCNFKNPCKSYRFSRLYVYQWNMKE